MAFWKPCYFTIEHRTVIENSTSQHQQLLDFGGQLCKVLFKNKFGMEVGLPETPITVVSWDTTSSSPRKIVWKER